jgi:hypothetical protein
LTDEANRKQHETAKQAAREQVLLAKELASREKEASYANDKTGRLLRMMEGCDVGIFEYSPDGKLLHANVRQTASRAPLQLRLCAHFAPLAKTPNFLVCFLGFRRPLIQFGH